jgi:ribosomal small subunit protein bTHX
MGKGDVRTRRGKISRGTHGKKHPKKEKEKTQETAGGKTKTATK